MNQNQVIIEGNIANIKVNDEGTFASFSLAYNRSYRDEGDEVTQETHWFRVVGFMHTAGYISRNLVQGDKVLVFGHLNTSQFKGDEGDVRLTQIVADSIRILYRKGEQSNQGATKTQAA
jgi:single stranded DNA-binding protein